MFPLYCFQFYIYSFCIQLFTVYTYVIYYGDLISSSFRDELQPEYDYIIVGSGTAGSLVAHRIATETNFTFIVLEAGSRSNVLMDMPIVGPAIHRSLFDWQYQTVPQEYACWAMHDHKCRLPQGKIFGGSSKLNNMVHFRGNISHYTHWFNGTHTEQYIRKQFDFIEKEALHLNGAQYESVLTNAILEAAHELGYDKLNHEFGKGFMRSRLSQRNGKRWSMSDNLKSEHVFTNVLVERVLIEDNEATGVEVLLLDKKKTIFARKGVILSAGTLNTPKILQLSGIGPSKLLKSLKIPVLQNLPVGENLQDHIASGLDLVMFNTSLSISGADIVNPINSIKYFFAGKGPLTTPGCEVIGFLSTKNEATPNLQFMVLPTGLSTDRGSHLRKSLGIKDNVWYDYFVKTFDKHTSSILPIVLHPKSKGKVFINTIDPQKPPVIDPKYLSNEEDRKTLIEGLKLVSRFINTKALTSIEAYLNPNPLPGCENYTIYSDMYWQCYIQHLTLPSYHPVGTCSMGLPQLKSSVVDTSFKVIGVKRLYVVDGSVLPTLPSGNINAAIAMMASLFFETNIKLNAELEVGKILVCFKYDLLYEFLLRICIVS